MVDIEVYEILHNVLLYHLWGKKRGKVAKSWIFIIIWTEMLSKDIISVFCKPFDFLLSLKCGLNFSYGSSIVSPDRFLHCPWDQRRTTLLEYLSPWTRILHNHSRHHQCVLGFWYLASWRTLEEGLHHCNCCLGRHCRTIGSNYLGCGLEEKIQ